MLICANFDKLQVFYKFKINAETIVELEPDCPVWLSGRLPVWGKLMHCLSPTRISDDGQSIDNDRISNVDLIAPTTCAVQRDDIDIRRSRKPRMQKIPLFRGICLYRSRGTRGSLVNEETKVVSRKRVGGTRQRGAECQLVKNTDRYPYVLDSMQQVFISAQYLPFPRNSLSTWRNKRWSV